MIKWLHPRADRTVLVEFIGLPGSGKSTMARIVAEQVRSRGIAVRLMNDGFDNNGRLLGALQRILLAVSAIGKRPALASRSIAHIAGSMQREWSDLRAVTTNLLFKWALVDGAASQDGVRISDEALLHAVWSIAYRARRRDALPEGLSGTVGALVPEKWMIVVVDAGTDAARARLVAREGRPNRLARDIGQDLNLALKEAEAGMEVVNELLDRVCQDVPGDRIRIVKLENRRDSDLAPNCDYLAGLIVNVAQGDGMEYDYALGV